MKNGLILLITAFLFSVVLFSGVSAVTVPDNQCCILNSTANCTFWDMGNWANGHDFCTKLPQYFSGLTTNYSSQACFIIAPSIISSCKDGFNFVTEPPVSIGGNVGGGGGGETPAYCGDGTCNIGESATTCPKDCKPSNASTTSNEIKPIPITPAETSGTPTENKTTSTPGITGSFLGAIVKPKVFIPIIFIALIVVLAIFFLAKRGKKK